MKLKINQACDLSAISVLPPHSRRSTAIPTAPQQSQIHTQPSQQSFSQPISSQHGTLSQFSQSSFEETLTNDQKIAAHERGNYVPKQLHCPPYCSREENHFPISLSSNNPTYKWNPSVSECKYQRQEELEHRLVAIEASLNKFGLILSSVQSDILQINKGTKELSLELESLRQKLTVDATLQLLAKGQEDVKSGIQGGLNSISKQIAQNAYPDKLQQLSLGISAMSVEMETSLLRFQNELRMSLVKEIQTMACSIASLNRVPETTLIPAKNLQTSGVFASPQGRPHLHVKSSNLSKTSKQQKIVPKVEAPVSSSGMRHQSTFTHWVSHMPSDLKVSPTQQENRCAVVESDEEMDGGFSCLLVKDKGFGSHSSIEIKEEAEHILKKARKRRHKSCNPIIIL